MARGPAESRSASRVALRKYHRQSSAPLGTCPALDGGLGDHDLDNSETDTAKPDDDIASLASYSFESVQPSSLELPGSPPCGRGCLRPAMALPHDHADQLPGCPVSPDDLQLENILDDHGFLGRL